MKHTLSDRALVNAITALHRDIERLNTRLASPNVTDETLQTEGEALLEMERALGEFVAIYKDRLKDGSSLPDLETLLGGKT